MLHTFPTPLLYCFQHGKWTGSFDAASSGRWNFSDWGGASWNGSEDEKPTEKLLSLSLMVKDLAIAT